MEQYDLLERIFKEIDFLEKIQREIKPRAQEKANAEHDYRVALSKRLTELRAAGHPVTHLADIARGEPGIAALRLKRDLAYGLYDSALEAINVQKLKIRVLDGQLSREWGAAK